ncbi:hypothetical protein FB451DRAFT_1188243 [Mycena latifolia]|nr:hypothetical protein FB451DRAFT_1188243 [Mycena latifolia]
MSIHIDGVLATSVTYQDIPRTALSVSFLARPDRSRLLVTTVVPSHRSTSTVLGCDMVSSVHWDVVLGRDWVACLRESLALHAAGYRLGSPFHAWTFLNDPSHPLFRVA